MARTEACQIWIEERIEEELQAEKSTSEIGRTIAAEIQKLFEATVNPDAIRIRAARIKARTNVQGTETPATARVEGGCTGCMEDAVSEVSRLHNEIVGIGGIPLVEKLARTLTPQEVVKQVDAIVKKGKSVREAAEEVAGSCGRKPGSLRVVLLAQKHRRSPHVGAYERWGRVFAYPARKPCWAGSLLYKITAQFSG